MNQGYFGRYRLEEELGRGAFAVVWRACDTVLEIDVALKILHPHRDNQEVRQRLRDEARALARLSHPGIVAYRGFETDRGRLGLVQELVVGGSLRKRLELGVFDTPAAAAIGRDAAEALAAAHDIALVHRDIKPSNLLLTAEGRVKVADFGLVKDLASPLHDESGVAGTVAFMSPEQVRAQKLDRRSDIFSLCVALFQMVTGRLPFDGVQATIGDFDPFLRPEASRIEPILASVLRRGLVRDLSLRYPDMRMLARDLAHVAAGDTSPPVRIAQPQPTIIGRRKELVRMQETLAASSAPGGHGCTLLVTGEAGIGKTRLIEEFSRLASHHSLIPVGISRFGVGQHGFQPIAEAMLSLVHLDPADPGEVLDTLRAAAGTPAPPAGSRPFPEILGQVLTLVARRGPFLIVLDNLHSAGPDALVLLRLALTGMSSTQGLLILSYRAEAESRSSELGSFVRWARGECLAEEVHLDRFGRSETAELMASLLEAPSSTDERLVDQIYRETEGNPFFVRQTIRYLIEAGLMSPSGSVIKSASTWPLLPPVRDVLALRLEALGPDLLSVLEVAAIEGEVFHTDVVDALLGWGRARTLDAIRRLVVHHGIVVPGERDYRFDHSKLRDVVGKRMLPEIRAEMHARVAEFLRKQDRPPASEIARHLVQAGRLEDALPFLIAAARQTSNQRATEEACALYEQACGVLQGYDRLTAQQLEVFLELADVAGLGGRSEIAREALRVVEQKGRHDPFAHGRALFKLGHLRFVSGDLKGARRLLRRAVDRFEAAGDGKWIAAGHDALGIFSHYAGDLPEARREARIALRRRQQLSYEPGIAMSRSNLGSLDYAVGNLRRALVNFNHACTYFARRKHKDLEIREKLATALTNVGVVSVELGQLERGLKAYREALSIQVAADDRHGEAMTRINQGDAYSLVGTWAAATDAYEIARRLTEPPGSKSLHSHALRGLGSVRLAQGAYGEALVILERAIADAQAASDAEAEARALLDAAPCRALLGDIKEGKHIVDRVRRFIAARKLLGLEALAAHVEGRVADRSHDTGSAVAAYRRALRALRTRPRPELRWRVLSDLSALLGRDARTAPEASRLRRQAVRQVMRLVSLISDPDLRRAYCSHPERAVLLEDEGTV